MGGTHRTAAQFAPPSPTDGDFTPPDVLAGVAVEVLYDPDDPSDAVLQMTIMSDGQQFVLAEMPLTSVKATKLQGQLQDQFDQASFAQHVAAGGDADTFVPASPALQMSAAGLSTGDAGEGVELDLDDDDNQEDGSAEDNAAEGDSKGRIKRKIRRVGDPGGVKPGIKRLATEMPPIMGFRGVYVVYGSLALLLVIAAVLSVVM